MPDGMLVALNEAAVEGLSLVDSVLLDYYPILPLYHIRPEYKIGASEQWKDIGSILRDGWGDCKDFTAWRLAELRKRGLRARAKSTVERQRKRLLFHTFIAYPDGTTEDPARILGM
jgi:hypothetical protein